MFPYSAFARNEPTQIAPWTSYGLIAGNFLVFFWELRVATQGTTAYTALVSEYPLMAVRVHGPVAISHGTPRRSTCPFMSAPLSV